MELQPVPEELEVVGPEVMAVEEAVGVLPSEVAPPAEQGRGP